MSVKSPGSRCSAQTRVIPQAFWCLEASHQGERQVISFLSSPEDPLIAVVECTDMKRQEPALGVFRVQILRGQNKKQNTRAHEILSEVKVKCETDFSTET